MTQSVYRLDIYNTAGALQYVLDFKEAPTRLSYTKRVNAPGVVVFDVAGDHDLLSDIADKWQVEVWRKPYGGSWVRELSAFYRDLDPWQYTDKSTATLKCEGILSMLAWRHVAYYANTTDRTKFATTAVETIANTLVTYNATTSGTTADGRLRAAAGGYPFTGLSVEADGAAGTAIDWYCAYDNLLANLQDLVKGEGDFDIVKTSSTAWQWRFYTGQLGTDKSATVVFALDRGNMKDPVFKDIRSREKTVAIVAGRGEDSDRDISIRTGANYAVGNDIEVFVAATDIELGETTALQARGDNKLAEREALKSFSFGVLDTATTQYNTDYNVGDLVKEINPYDGTAYTVKVEAASITFDSKSDEKIDLDVRETL